MVEKPTEAQETHKANSELMKELRQLLHSSWQTRGTCGLKREVCITLVETFQEIISSDPSLDGKFSRKRSLGLLNLAWIIRYVLHGADITDTHVQKHHNLALEFLQNGEPTDRP